MLCKLEVNVVGFPLAMFHLECTLQVSFFLLPKYVYLKKIQFDNDILKTHYELVLTNALQWSVSINGTELCDCNPREL